MILAETPRHEFREPRYGVDFGCCLGSSSHRQTVREKSYKSMVENGISQTSETSQEKGQKQPNKKKRSNLEHKNDNVFFFFRLVLSRFFSLG